MASDAGNLVMEGAAAYFTGGASLAGGGIGGGMSGGKASAPSPSSRSGDASATYGDIGGVSIGGGKSEQNTLYVALAAVAAVVLLVVARR